MTSTRRQKSRSTAANRSVSSKSLFNARGNVETVPVKTKTVQRRNSTTRFAPLSSRHCSASGKEKRSRLKDVDTPVSKNGTTGPIVGGTDNRNNRTAATPAQNSSSSTTSPSTRRSNGNVHGVYSRKSNTNIVTPSGHLPTMSSSSSRSSHRSGRNLSGASPPGNSSRVMRKDIVSQQGVSEGHDGSENDDLDIRRDRFSSSEDDSQSHAPSGSSSGASIDLVGNRTLNNMSHEAAVNREKDRVMQRKMYGEDRGFPYSVDLANSVKRVLKEKIFPKIKLLSDTEPHYMAPDFVGPPVDQSRNICDVLIRELDMPDELEDKIGFWITYRSLVKNQLVKFRSNCVEELKKQYFRVKDMLDKDEAVSGNETYLNGCRKLMGLLEHAGNNEECDIIALREENDEDLKEAFFFFAREFLPCIVKRLVFRQFKLVNLLSEFVTISDEAFTLLLLENNVARWNVMFAAGKNKSDYSMPSQKFNSVCGQQQNNGGGVKDGYSFKAATRYMEYFDYVERARMYLGKDSLEMELLKRMESLDTGKSRSARGKRKRDGELNYFNEEGAPMRIRYEAL